MNARMFDKRLAGYRAIGYTIDDEPLVDDAAYNCDEDGLRSFYYVEEDNEEEGRRVRPAALVSPGIDYADALPDSSRARLDARHSSIGSKRPRRPAPELIGKSPGKS